MHQAKGLTAILNWQISMLPLIPLIWHLLITTPSSPLQQIKQAPSPFPLHCHTQAPLTRFTHCNTYTRSPLTTIREYHPPPPPPPPPLPPSFVLECLYPVLCTLFSFTPLMHVSDNGRSTLLQFDALHNHFQDLHQELIDMEETFIKRE